MGKQIKQTLKSAQVADFAKHAQKVRDAHLRKAKAYQLPVKAHTSTNAKIALAVSVIYSSVALGAVLATLAHSVAYSKSETYRKKVDAKRKKADIWADSTAEKANSVAEDFKGKTSVAANEAVNKAEESAELTKAKADEKVAAATARVNTAAKKAQE